MTTTERTIEAQEADGASGGAGVELRSIAPEDLVVIEEMIEAGLLYGLNKSKTHPGMRGAILLTRSGVEVINLEQTLAALKKSVAFLSEALAGGRQLLFVGTTPVAQASVRATAERLRQPYVTERWLGGTLTNFKVVSKRVERLKKLTLDREAGALGKYTKKERLMIDREVQKMRVLFGGIEHMAQLPGALVVVNPIANGTAVREARRMKIPVVALMNTNANPAEIAYPIPGNDRIVKGVAWALDYLERGLAVKTGGAEGMEKVAEETPTPEKRADDGGSQEA